MNKRLCLPFIAALLLLQTTAIAQWPAFKDAKAPRTADGKVDRNGPAPKMADGKPDFSGVWERPGGGPGAGGPPGGGPPPGAGPGGPPPNPGANSGEAAPGGIPAGGFQNMGINMPGQLLPYQPWALALRNKRLAKNSADHPDAHCLPINPVQLNFHPQPRKISQTPQLLIMMAEANGGLRQIFTDGRTLPTGDVQPWWFGYSVGKWEGDTLVVETMGMLDNAWIDEQGSPISSQARVTERFRRPNFGTLEIEITVNDPKAYTKPWTVTANQRLMPDDELIEFICGENNVDLPHLDK